MCKPDSNIVYHYNKKQSNINWNEIKAYLHSTDEIWYLLYSSKPKSENRLYALKILSVVSYNFFCSLYYWLPNTMSLAN